jgi:hypothetical protein
MIQYHAENPFRSVNWRWERARLIREGALRGGPRKKEDPWVQAAVKFQQALARCRDDADQYMLLDKNPGLYHAWMAHLPIGDDEQGTPLRYYIEARLMTGETCEQVAEALGCSTDLVDWYEKLFFNVSEKLKYRGYVMTCVISPTLHTGLSPSAYDVLWKVFAYLYGPVALDAIVQGTSSIHHAETAEETDAKFATDVQASIRRKAAIAARTYGLNNFTQEGLMNIYARFLEIDKAQDTGSAKDAFLVTVNTVLGTLPFADGAGSVRPDLIAGGKAVLKVDQPVLEHYDNESAELRTDELLTVAAGRDLPNRTDLEDMKFPELPNARTQEANQAK